MAHCNWCHQEMTSADTPTCSANLTVEFPDGEQLPAIAYGQETRFGPGWEDDPQRCHDCNVASGGQHHPGCDVEECPRCRGQLISCGCLEEETEEE